MTTRRTQPMRASRKRRQTPALRAAQRGAPAYLTTAHMKRRAAMRKRKRRSTPKTRDPLLRLLYTRRKLS